MPYTTSILTSPNSSHESQINYDYHSTPTQTGKTKPPNFTKILFLNLLNRVPRTTLDIVLMSAIQVQVLARDLECWIVDYRAYLTRADSLIAALKAWMTCETKQSHPSYESWEVFFVHIESVSSQIFPVLQKSIQTKCIQPLQVLFQFVNADVVRICTTHLKGQPH